MEVLKGKKLEQYDDGCNSSLISIYNSSSEQEDQATDRHLVKNKRQLDIFWG